jgi:DNA (cytosine-5)-methyltransferase 1
LIIVGAFVHELALFAGAGGGILGGKLLGWRTVCAVEWEPYPASVLAARQNDKILPSFPIWDDVQTFDGKPWRGIVDVVSGGFPCQDISVAGKGDGLDGERSGMWREMARIISEVRPRYAFVENSPMLVTRGLERVLADLTKMGYDSRWGVISAADIGANHKRERIWIVGKMGNSNNNGQTTAKIGNSIIERSYSSETWQKQTCKSKGSGEQYGEMGNTKKLFSNGSNDNSRISLEHEKKFESGNNGWSEKLAHTCNEGLQRHRNERINDESIEQKRFTGFGFIGGCRNWWKTEPNVGRVADGVDARVDRLKAIGNGQVPLCAATAWRILSA